MAISEGVGEDMDLVQPRVEHPVSVLAVQGFLHSNRQTVNQTSLLNEL
jgi:hypothetical protein